MIKYICVLLAAGMLVACEKKTETVTPSASPTPSSETSPAADESATTESPAAETSSPTP